MDITSLLVVAALTAAVIGVGMLAMAVGAMFKRTCLRGSCGGSPVHRASGEVISCADCPNRDKRQHAPIPSPRRPPAPQAGQHHAAHGQP